MKKILVLAILLVATMVVYAQESAVTLSGGYASANTEDTDIGLSGFRINGLYEFTPLSGHWAHGFSLGYVKLSGEQNVANLIANYDVTSWPIYYAPKFLFGGEKFKGFAKGAIGYQFSKLNKTALIELEDNDGGFLGGGGVGVMYNFSEKIFISAEYEMIWMSNSFYRDGWLSAASAGIGFRF